MAIFRAGPGAPSAVGEMLSACPRRGYWPWRGTRRTRTAAPARVTWGIRAGAALTGPGPPGRRNTVTSTPAAPTGAPGTGPVPGKVFRSELNPVDFLHRAAYIYPDKTAV